ncbi:MAG: hypothetical protein IJ253_03515 [Bacteroidaceae bacterium]|nr:hypothetical protein [Bacteroidaceae bacterium]
MKRFLYVMLLSGLCLNMSGQATRQEMRADPRKAGGVYMAYPHDRTLSWTPAPEGYSPVYISHYGRHGSRYLTMTQTYENLIHVLEDARKQDALTPLGESVLPRLKAIWRDAQPHMGELTSLGAHQHQGIARRLYAHCEELLSRPGAVSAHSSVVGRCQESMRHFCEELQRQNPSLSVTTQSKPEDMFFVANFSEGNPDSCEHVATHEATMKRISDEQQRLYDRCHILERLVNADYFRGKAQEADTFNKQFYSVAEDMQSLPELGITLDDAITTDECIHMMLIENLEWGRNRGFFPSANRNYQVHRHLLEHILDCADQALATGSPAAELRFGHDAVLIPLCYILRLDGCYDTPEKHLSRFHRHWVSFRVSPMAGNLQMIWYRKPGSDDLLVKFLLNEEEKRVPEVATDAYPYYHWQDIRAYWQQRLKEL